MHILEKAAYVAVISAALVSSGTLLEQRFARRAVSAHQEQLAGQHIAIAGVDWKSSPVNAVLFISTHCKFCAESLPFYRRLSEARSLRPAGVALRVVSLDPPDNIRRYLAEHQVSVDGVYPLDRSLLPLSGTPTILIADRTGLVSNSFVGALDSRREAAVLKAFEGTTERR